MMSAGWDSRTLLAAGTHALASGTLTGYSHGDTASRELRIVRDLCSAAAIPLDLEPIDDGVWEVATLQRSFARVENVVFPHWHRAGALLAQRGVAWVAAGVYGEILGGQYGSTMLGSPRQRAARFATTLVRSRCAVEPSPRELLQVRALGRHWYLRREYEQSIPEATAAMQGEIESAIVRLEERGIPTNAQVVEAFISEHRGSQYINAQILSCRAHCDVVLPFADRRLLQLAASTPLRDKIHNVVNRQLLDRHARDLLAFPLAATLTSARAPLLAQEASRVARSLYESSRWRLHFSTRGRVAPPRLGWVNFEFLRTGAALNGLIDDLQGDLWDRDALRQRVRSVTQGEERAQLHPLFDQMSKIYTTDLLLR